MKRFFVIVILGSLCAWTLARAGDTSSSSEETYLKKVENDVQEWTVKLKSLQERSEKSGAKTREELDRNLKAISDQLAVARKELGVAKSSGEGGAKNVRQELEEALREVKSDYRKALSFFNDKTTTKEKS